MKNKKIQLELPLSFAETYNPYKLPTANNNVLILSDCHFPYQNNNAIEMALKYGKEQNMNTILLNGDMLDFYQLSTYEKDPHKRSVKDELYSIKVFLDLLKYRFPKVKIFWKDGNHELRFQRFMQRNAAVLIGIDEFELPVLLDFRNRGITYIENHIPILAGELMILHGNETKTGGINPAKSTMDKLGISTLSGDKHRSQMFVKPTANGKLLCSWSTGHLGETNPKYMPLNQWNLGFAHLIIRNDKSFKVTNCMVDTSSNRIY